MKKSKSSIHRADRDGISYRIFDDVVGLASTLFQNRKSIGADQLQSLAKATRAYGASMTELPTLQRQVNLASENISNFADYVLNTDIQHMVADATVLARRRPLLTLAISAAAGLAATRMVSGAPLPSKSTRRKRTSKKTHKPKVTARRSMNGSSHAHA